MGAPESNTTNIYGIHLRESANDGSDFSNGATDYRVVYLGEDGALHAKDSAGTVTSLSGATDHGALTGLTDDDHTQYLKETDVAAKGDIYAASANDTVGVLSVGTNGQVLTADSTQSLGVKWGAAGGTGDVLQADRPELTDNATAGTPLDFTGASLDTSVSRSALTNTQGRFSFPANATSYADIASAIGTGDFDLRARITRAYLTTPTSTVLGSLVFCVTDGSRTASTRLGVRCYGQFSGTALPYIIGQVGTSESGGALRPTMFPTILRVRRTGTAVTYESSSNEGASWIQHHTSTSSLNVGKVALLGTVSASGSPFEVVLHWVRSV